MDEFRRRPVTKAGNAPSQPRPVAATPQRPVSAVHPKTPSQPPVQQKGPLVSSQPLDAPTGLSSKPSKKPRKRPIFWIITGVVAALILAFGAALLWYAIQLSPVNSGDTSKKLITIEAGSAPATIAESLENEKVIRSASAFLWYARLNKVQNNLQAGTYRLSPSESTPEIIEHLSKGNVDTFSITFLPGATLDDNRQALLDVGYSADEVDAALDATYTSPLFEGKPAGADLEGYIYGETYSFGTDTSVKAILEHVFDQFYSVIQENNLVALYQSHGLSLYEGITLASIVQREASPQGDDMPQIAQVFYSRLATGMPLGSDVTYQYIADKTGVARNPNLDSPYNTRKYAGLPPGPISAPGKKALVAVANPAPGDYLYFLSGDDDVTYYARTLDEHEANIANHCQKKCQIL